MFLFHVINVFLCGATVAATGGDTVDVTADTADTVANDPHESAPKRSRTADTADTVADDSHEPAPKRSRTADAVEIQSDMAALLLCDDPEQGSKYDIEYVNAGDTDDNDAASSTDGAPAELPFSAVEDEGNTQIDVNQPWANIDQFFDDPDKWFNQIIDGNDALDNDVLDDMLDNDIA